MLSCTAQCTFDTTTCTWCGNKKVEAGEACDDGNLSNGDACTTSCQKTSCGDGVVQVGEECDEGPDNADTKAAGPKEPPQYNLTS